MKKLLSALIVLTLLLSAAFCASAEEEVVITIMTSEHPKYPYNTQTQQVFEWIHELTGVTLEIEAISSDSYEEKKSVMLATNNLPDVIQVTQGDLSEYARLGAFVNLREYEALLPNYMAARAQVPNIELTEVDGGIYSFAKIGWEPMLGKTGPAIRTDLLEANGIAIPTNYDELADVLRQLKALYPDSYPWSARQMWSFMNELCYNFGTVDGLAFDVDKDQYVYGYLTPEMKDVLSYLHMLYEEGLLDPDFYTNSNDQLTADIATESCFFIMNNVNFIPDYNAALQNNNPDGHFEMIEPLAHGDVRRGLVGNPYEMIGTGFAVSAQAENIEQILSFFDWLYSEEGAITTNFGKEGVTFEYVNGVPEFTDYVLRENKSEADVIKEVELGLTHNIMAVYYNQRQWYASQVNYEGSATIQNSEKISQWYEEGLLQMQPAVAPSLTEEETEEYAEIFNVIDTIASENCVKFIIGERSLDEYDAFVEELQEAGAERAVEIYNTAYDRTR